MLAVDIPNEHPIQINYLVMDFNGTLACDGQLYSGVKRRLLRLAAQLDLHVLTADTFGSAGRELQGLPCQLSILAPAQQAQQKRHYIEQLGCQQTVTIGNGRNDHEMLKAAALGIIVLQEEGAAVETLLAADIVAPNILVALDLLLNPQRLVATLRR